MTTKIDWPALIGRHVLVHQKIRDLDTEKLWRHELPSMRASAEAIERVQITLGPLPTQFHDFLSYANGWRAFYQWVDLFGTDELAGAARVEAQSALNVLRSKGCFPELASDWRRLLPIAATRKEKQDGHLGADVFVIVQSGVRAGVTYWIGGEELVDEFQDFYGLFLAMTAYTEKEVARLTVERQKVQK